MEKETDAAIIYGSSCYYAAVVEMAHLYLMETDVVTITTAAFGSSFFFFAVADMETIAVETPDADVVETISAKKYIFHICAGLSGPLIFRIIFLFCIFNFF